MVEHNAECGCDHSDYSPLPHEAEIEIGIPLTVEEKLALGIELTRDEKVDYIFSIAQRADGLIREVGPQVGPLLESLSSNPMLKMFLR